MAHPGFTPGHIHHFRGGHFFPFYGASFGLGLALGLNSFYDPWFHGFYDGPYPYYGYYAPYPPPAGYAPPAPGAEPAPPSGEAAAQPPAACGSWSWDTAKQVYNWVPCAAPAAPAN